MRDVFTFTIDPADAKDFDDALSFLPLGDGTVQVGVHIADVSHYVQPGDAIDTAAYAKGTSVYLVDKVLPMLPEELCNDLCSLRPHEEKLCMSVIFTMDAEAKVLKYKICRTVIRSDHRLTYDEAQSLLTGQDESEIAQVLRQVNALALILRRKRFAEGSLYLEQESVHFRLDAAGEPVEIYFEEPNEAHHLIEEWMLLANRTVATAVGGRPFVYRIHDKPNEEKLSDLREFKKRMGDKVQPQVVEMLTIRAMAKAVYSTHNIGHYGLAFSHYTHFTSPIRRYPDLMVHRLLDKYLLRGKGATPAQEELEERCHHCTEMEIAAQMEERDSIKMYQAKWMEKFVGEELPGHIVSVTDFGLFVQLDESRCEGLIHIHSVRRGDFMQHDEKNYRLIAAHSGETFTLGDAVVVRVIRADAEKRQVDFVLADEADPAPRRERKSHGTTGKRSGGRGKRSGRGEKDVARAEQAFSRGKKAGGGAKKAVGGEKKGVSRGKKSVSRGKKHQKLA